jgi:hypothetical protein
VHEGDSIAVQGSGFIPGVGARGVDILMGADTVVAGAEVRKDGTFVVQLPVKRGPGVLDITAIQRTDRGERRGTNSVTVIEGETDLAASHVAR